MHALRYAFQEAVASLWRGRQSGLMSTATIALALFVLGLFLVVTANLDRLSEEWGRTAALSVYLEEDLPPAARAELERLLAPGPIVARVEFVGKDEALRRFKAAFADLASTVDSLQGNPLPESFEVALGPAAASDSQALEAFVATVREADGVTDVRYDREWLQRLESATRLLRRAGLLLGTLLTLAAALAVANVVRLGLHARREELEIMQLVGAPMIYVRGPFVVEGLLQGGLGALTAVIALAIVFVAARARYLQPLASAVNLSSVRFLSPGAVGLLLGGGMVVGCFGGWLACRRIRTVTQSVVTR